MFRLNKIVKTLSAKIIQTPYKTTSKKSFNTDIEGQSGLAYTPNELI